MPIRRIAPRSYTSVEPAERPSAVKRLGAADLPPVEPRSVQMRTTEQLRGLLVADDIASGRGVTYEWERYIVEVLDRLETVETEVGAGTVASYVHTQGSAAATWNITHNLNTKPVVVVVSTANQQLMAEVHYPTSNTVDIIFGSPYAGSAYLRG